MHLGCAFFILCLGLFELCFFSCFIFFIFFYFFFAMIKWEGGFCTGAGRRGGIMRPFLFVVLFYLIFSYFILSSDC